LRWGRRDRRGYRAPDRSRVDWFGGEIPDGPALGQHVGGPEPEHVLRGRPDQRSRTWPIVVWAITVPPVALRPVAVRPVAVRPVAVRPVAVRPVAVLAVADRTVATSAFTARPARLAGPDDELTQAAHDGDRDLVGLSL